MPNANLPIRVLVVDDSFFMRTVLAKMLQESGGIEIIGQARTGQEAVEKNLALEPDVVTLDVEMPGMDGLTALERMMASRPVPVVMLSAHTSEGAECAVKALEMGAVECLGKPSGSVSIDIHRIKEELFEKILTASRSRPRIHRPETLRERGNVPAAVKPPRTRCPARILVAVAASTGGPKALKEFLGGLEAAIQAAVLIVQHIPTGFTAALARRLSEAGSVPVSEAQDGETLLEGQGYVAPAGIHLEVCGRPGDFRVRTNDGPPMNGVKPAADVLMASVALAAGSSAVGLVLTGMGKDGARGLLEMRKAGAATYAQDEASCVVYGMPKAALDCGAVTRGSQIADICAAVMRGLQDRPA